MKRIIVGVLIAIGVLVVAGCSALSEQPSGNNSEGGDVTSATAKQIDKSGFRRAPELSSEVWLNGAPTSLAELRGKVVLVDFWTFG